MDILKPALKSASSPKQPNAGRGSFIRKTGAALSAVLASAVAGASKPRAVENEVLKGRVDRLTHQRGILEDTNGIRKLHHAYIATLARYGGSDVPLPASRDREAVERIMRNRGSS